MYGVETTNDKSQAVCVCVFAGCLKIEMTIY